VAVIPHHLSLPVPFDDAPSTGRGHPVDREAIRHDLSLAGYFVVGSFGFMTAAKRPKVLLRAFARFQRRHPDAICCMVGQEFPTVDLAGLIREAGLSPDTVRITGRMPLDGFLRYMIASDIAVNLRYPTSGETSGSVIRLLGLGVPTVVSDVGAFSELPDPVCAKVPVDAWEEDTLVAILEALAADDQQRQAMSANARRHIRTHHSLEGSAQAYAAFIEQVNAGDARPAGPLGASPAAEVISDIGTTLAGWGITEHHDSLLQPIAQPLAQLGIAPEPGHWEDTIESRDL
jgi:glycosyltransferase involved in cell wall biosynthesis